MVDVTHQLARRVSRRRFLSDLSAAAIAGGLAPRLLRAEDSPEPSGRPNVLFIGVDDLRPQLASYGCSQMKTPNIDRLAEIGLQFNRAYVQQAVCAASRASLLTGCRPDTTGVDMPMLPWFISDFLPSHPDIQTFMHSRGYYTRTLGKVHHAPAKFPSFRNLTEVHYVPEARFYALAEHQQAGTRKEWTRPAPAWEMADLPDDVYMDGQVAAAAIATIRRAVDQDKPFFIAPGFEKPHLPFSCPKRYWDLYTPDDIKLPEVDHAGPDVPPWAISHAEIGFYAGIEDPADIPEEVARRLIHGYYACVSFVDAQIGKLLDELESRGLMDNTVIVLWGDHGWHLGDHGTWCKHSNFERATRSPLIVRAPGMPTAGRQCDALVEYVDIFPTVLDMCGFEVPDYVEGVSLTPLLEKEDRPWKKAAFSQYPRGEVEGYSIRTASHRYTEWRDRRTGEVRGRELYDHDRDPLEATNVVAAEAYRGVVERLAAQLAVGWKAALPPGVTSSSNNPRGDDSWYLENRRE
jgi:iduronate 2-sulfatase